MYAVFLLEPIHMCVHVTTYKLRYYYNTYKCCHVKTVENPDREIVGILKKSGIVNHFKGDIRLTEGGSESVKKTFATF